MTKTKFSNFTVLLILIFFTPLFSQNNFQSTSLLKVQIPSKNDTVSFSKMRISGSTRPGAEVLVNGRSIKVYPSGAFVDRVNLRHRMNRIEISAADFRGDTTTVFYIFREPPIPVSPENPVEIDKRIMWPEKNIILISGDFLEVRFKGSPGGKAKFKINKLCKNIPMTELPPESASGMRGIYSGIVKLESKKSIDSQAVEFELRGKNGRKIRARSEGRVSVIPDYIPLIGQTIGTSYLKTTPYGLGVISILPAGVKMVLVGKRGNHYKVRLTTNKYAFILAEDVKVLPLGTPTPKTSISLPSVSFEKDWIKLNMPVSTKCPFTIHQTVNPAMLELTVFGAFLTSQWTTYPDFDSTIKMIRWRQPSANVFKLFVDLNQTQQWGHRVRYEQGRLILEIRKTPEIAKPPRSPVAGLTFTLDAGHGGFEKGAVGPTGLMEKNVNLIYTKKLAALLDSAGARVVLTRENDLQMSLADRLEIARQENTHIFCWLHNNSVGATSDAAGVRGASTYFTIPQNQTLAWTIYPHLLNIGLKPFGRVQSDYYITRRTDMLIVLVEGAFMSNPEDEMLLMEDNFLDKLAQAVFDGLEDFCRNQFKSFLSGY